MPNNDGTGPIGHDTAAGRNAGWCRGWIKAKNCPRGMFGWLRKKLSPQEEKKMLQEEALMLEEEAAEIEKRIQQLKEY